MECLDGGKLYHMTRPPGLSSLHRIAPGSIGRPGLSRTGVKHGIGPQGLYPGLSRAGVKHGMGLPASIHGAKKKRIPLNVEPFLLRGAADFNGI